MKREEILDLLVLLSALESWSFSTGNGFPAYLDEKLECTMDALRKKLLEDGQ